jgi:hypothetical protein
MPNARNAGWIWSSLAAGSLRAVAFQLTLSYLLPIGIPVLIGYLGLVQGLPWMHVAVGVGLMFACVTTGLVRLDDWLERRRVRDKLTFASIRFGRNISGPGMFLGVVLNSRASVPVEFEVVEVRTKIGDRVPTKTKFEVTRVIVPVGSNAWFDDHVIDIGTPPKQGSLEGFVEFRFKYGRVGALKHDLIVKKQVLLAFNGAGQFERGSWHDAQ